jgi:hypothetical protein
MDLLGESSRLPAIRRAPNRGVNSLIVQYFRTIAEDLNDVNHLGGVVLICHLAHLTLMLR